VWKSPTFAARSRTCAPEKPVSRAPWALLSGGDKSRELHALVDNHEFSRILFTALLTTPWLWSCWSSACSTAATGTRNWSPLRPCSTYITYFFGSDRHRSHLFGPGNHVALCGRDPAHPTNSCSKYCMGMAARNLVLRHNRFLPALRKLNALPPRQEGESAVLG